MTNPYYAHSSGVPATLTRAASSQIRNEYDLIEDGFDLIDTAIDAKANIDSPTFTGTVTVPTPLTAAAAATKEYVDALSVAAGNVPTGGSTGQYLVKDSATDYDMSWGSIVSVGTGGTTSTASITLTASSAAAMSVTPATPGLYVTLPDATTCTKADNLYSVYNAGDYDYGVKDSAGTQLGWIRARTGAMIGLADNSTAAGVWAYYGLEKTGITASYVNSTLTNMGSTIRRIALDANRTCFLFGGVDCYAIVYDASTQTWGSATLVRATVASGAFLGVLAGTDKVLVCSCTTGVAGQFVVLSIAGTTVTVNTPVAKTFPGATFNSFGQLIAVGASFVVSYGHDSNTATIQAVTVSGTVPTVGTEYDHSPGVGTGTPAILFAAGSVVRCILANSSVLRCQPATISGTTITPGTSASPTTTNANVRAFLNGNGNIVCHYINTTHYATIFKLTGTVEAASSVSLGTAPTAFLTNCDYGHISASKTLFTALVSGATWYANILTDTAGTASAGTQLSGAMHGNASAPGIPVFYVSGNTAYVAASTTTQSSVLKLDCSGASPTLAANVSIHATGITNDAAYLHSSDEYGVKRPNQAYVGGAAVTLGSYTNGSNFNLKGLCYSANGIWQIEPAAIAGNFLYQYGVTVSNTESFVNTQYIYGGTVGQIIQRVESAA